MFKNTESADFSAIIIFYLIILQLLNNDNDTPNSPITLFELVEYFKRNKKIVIDVNVYKKLLTLFNKHKELLSTMQIKNKSQIISDISKLVKTYNKTGINKNFVASFYKKLKKEFPACDYAQLVFCAAVFEEVGIINITREPFGITVNKVKADLNNSKLYVRVKEENNRAGC